MFEYETAYPCPCCQIGHCHLERATYTRMYDGMLVSVPDMPVWTCDICGHQEFEREAVIRVDDLLGKPENLAEIGRFNSKLASLDGGDSKTIGRIKP